MNQQSLAKDYHNTHPFRPSADLSHFFVIVPITNSARYQIRYELYWDFIKMCQDAGVNVITVEQAFGHRPFMVTEPNNQFHVQVRGVDELWLKENLIKLGIVRATHIDPKVREVAWIDADCFPMCPGRVWFEEIWHSLQHYEFVQCWSTLRNYGPNYEPISGEQYSFMKVYEMAGFQVPESRTIPNPNHTLAMLGAKDYGTISFGRPGLAWAANVDALNRVGGLLERCILGSADWHMAHGLVGAMQLFSGEFSKLSKYAEYLLDWQDKALKWIDKDVGYVNIALGHWFHGNKKDRKYGDRGRILIENLYDPYIDVKYDAFGVLQLETYTDRQIRLRDLIRAYIHSRNEDSIDVQK